MFLIFYFWSWIFEKTSKFWAASCKNESNLLLARITVCIESFLPIGGHTFIWWKNLPKSYSIFVWIAEWWNSLPSSRNPKNNWNLAFMEYGLAKKIAVWDRDPNKQEDWIQFCIKRLRTLKSFKIFKSEIKKLKTYSGWCSLGLSNDITLM
jgi:hypothetical protein